MALKKFYLSNQKYSAGDVDLAMSQFTTKGVSMHALQYYVKCSKNDEGALEVISSGTESAGKIALSNVKPTFDTIVAGDFVKLMSVNPPIAYNNAISNFVQKGINLVPNACKVVQDGNKFKILPGTCFCHDGAMLIIDEPYILSSTANDIKYIYVRRDLVTDDIVIMETSTEPSANDICLAKLYNGAIYDNRQFATSKVAVPTNNIRIDLTVTQDRNKTVEYDIGYAGINFAYWIETTDYNSLYRLAFIDFSDEQYNLRRTRDSVDITMYKNGSVITIKTGSDWLTNQTIHFL